MGSSSLLTTELKLLGIRGGLLPFRPVEVPQRHSLALDEGHSMGSSTESATGLIGHVERCNDAELSKSCSKLQFTQRKVDTTVAWRDRAGKLRSPPPAKTNGLTVADSTMHRQGLDFSHEFCCYVRNTSNESSKFLDDGLYLYKLNSTSLVMYDTYAKPSKKMVHLTSWRPLVSNTSFNPSSPTS